MLSHVSEICRKHGIAYYAMCGTLLGAVRHGGFIPWDDDIALMRDDYIRLLKVLPEELAEGYFVNSYYTCETHRQPWASVVNTQYILQDAEKIKRFWGCPYVCGIDIFPLDYLPQDAGEDDMYMKMYEIVFGVAQGFERYQASGELQQYIPQIEELCGVALKNDETLQRQMFLLADQIAGLYHEDECKELTQTTLRLEHKNPAFKFRKEWFQQVEEIPFENITISIPKQCHNILQIFFGGDYMTPMQCNWGHEYPFYKRQQQFLDDYQIVLPVIKTLYG